MRWVQGRLFSGATLQLMLSPCSHISYIEILQLLGLLPRSYVEPKFKKSCNGVKVSWRPDANLKFKGV